MNDVETDAVLDVCLGDEIREEQRRDVGDDWERDVALSDAEGESELDEAERVEARALQNVYARTELQLTRVYVKTLIECGALRKEHGDALVAKLDYVDSKLRAIRSAEVL